VHRYLEEIQADYEGEALDVMPQRVMNVSSEALQEIHEFIDGSREVVEFSENDYFDVELQWSYVTEAESDHIKDLFYNPFKAKRFKRSFYWKHPIDGEFYTVYFQSNLREQYRAGPIRGITTLTLRVVGLKPTWE